MSCQLEHVVLYYMWIEGGDERSGGGSGEHWMTEQRPYCAVCQCACMCVCAKEALTAVSKSPNSHKSAPPSCASPSHVLCCTSSVQIHSWAITPSIPRYKHVLVCVCVCVCVSILNIQSWVHLIPRLSDSPEHLCPLWACVDARQQVTYLTQKFQAPGSGSLAVTQD